MGSKPGLALLVCTLTHQVFTLRRGCTIFREALLLVDETTSSLSIKQFVAYVVAHELAHQWYA